MEEVIRKLVENGTIVLATLGLIGYFIKRLFDLKSRKVEIRYTLFHQAKLKSMIEFQAAFFSLEKELRNYIKNFIKRENINLNQFETTVGEKLRQFNLSHENTRFFIKDLHLPAFDRQSKNLWHLFNNMKRTFTIISEISETEREKKIEEFKRIKEIYFGKFKFTAFQDINTQYRKEFEKDTSADMFK